MTRAWHANDDATTQTPRKNEKSRQRSTLPHSHPCSTIDAKELNFRVRDGIGCGLFAIITGKIVEESNFNGSSRICLVETCESHVFTRECHSRCPLVLQLQRGGEVIKPND